MSELEIWNELGRIYYNSGAYEEAIRIFSRALELEPGNGQAYNHLAACYIHKGLPAEAIPLLQKGIELLDRTVEKALLWNRLGDAYRQLDDQTHAAAAYRQAIELDPNNVTFRDNLIAVEVDSVPRTTEGEIAETEPKAEDAADSDSPASDSAHLETGIGEGSGTIQEVPAELPEAGEESEPETACWVFKGQTSEDSAKPGEEDSLEPVPVVLGSRLLSESPVEPPEAVDAADPAQEQKAIAAAASAEPVPEITEAEEASIPSVVLTPADEARSSPSELEKTLPTSQTRMSEASKARANALLQVGVQQWRKGEYEQAARLIDDALDLAAGSAEDQFEALCFNALGLVESDRGDRQAAIRAYENAGVLNPTQAFPWRKLGALYSQLNRYEEALAVLQKAIEHNPKDSATWNSLGDVYHKLGRGEDAIAAYQLGNVFENQERDRGAVIDGLAALEEIQEDPQVWKEMGNIYYQEGAYEQALAAYRKAVELETSNSAPYESPALIGTADEPAAAELPACGAEANQPESTSPESPLGELPSSDLDEADTPMPAKESELDAETVETISNEQEAPDPNHEPELIESAQVEATDAILEEQADPVVSADQPETVENVDESETVPDEQPDPVNPAEEPEPGAPAEAEASELIPDDRLEPAVPDDEPRSGNAYWVFGSGRPSEKAVQPKMKYITAPAGTAVDTLDPTPAFALPHFADRPFLDNRALDDLHPDRASETAVAPAEAYNQELENEIIAYRRVTEINPKNDRAWDALGNMYEAAGLHSEAIAAFEQAIALAPQREVYHYHLGLAYAAQTHYDKAIHALERVIELNPEYILAHCALAGYYRRVGKEEAAQEHIAIARPAMENENEYNRACFESICGNVVEAIEFLKTALAKQQIQLDWVRSDPDLEFIRDDPRFAALLRKNGHHAVQ